MKTIKLAHFFAVLEAIDTLHVSKIVGYLVRYTRRTQHTYFGNYDEEKM